MKSNLLDSKKLNSKTISGYTSSYTDKYKKKQTKPSFELDRFTNKFQKSFETN